MATTIDTRPMTADLKIYGGDTFEVYVITVDDFSTWTWTAQVRKTHGGTVDASFTIGADEMDGGFHKRLLTLSATDTRDLVDAPGALQNKAVAPMGFVTAYRGIWDVQVENSGVVKTLAQGDVTVESDVTRP